MLSVWQTSWQGRRMHSICWSHTGPRLAVSPHFGSAASGAAVDRFQPLLLAVWDNTITLYSCMDTMDLQRHICH
jgi:hypothetical protein